MTELVISENMLRSAQTEEGEENKNDGGKVCGGQWSGDSKSGRGDKLHSC